MPLLPQAVRVLVPATQVCELPSQQPVLHGWPASQPELLQAWFTQALSGPQLVWSQQSFRHVVDGLPKQQ
jgi:hypothetical protein